MPEADTVSRSRVAAEPPGLLVPESLAVGLSQFAPTLSFFVECLAGGADSLSVTGIGPVEND